MCVIIAGQKDQLTQEEWKQACEANPHGFGFAFISKKSGKLQRLRTLDIKKATGEYFEYAQKHADHYLLLHARITTAGKTNLTNCHPFFVAQGRALMAHNGVMPEWEKAPNKGYIEISDDPLQKIIKNKRFQHTSDSYHLATVLNTVPLELMFNLTDNLFKQDSNRFAFLTDEGYLVTYNGEYDKQEVWRSNTSHLYRSRRYQYNHDIWTENWNKQYQYYQNKQTQYAKNKYNQEKKSLEPTYNIQKLDDLDTMLASLSPNQEDLVIDIAQELINKKNCSETQALQAAIWAVRKNKKNRPKKTRIIDHAASYLVNGK